jgi:protein tyrosine/serine phosphatase
MRALLSSGKLSLVRTTILFLAFSTVAQLAHSKSGNRFGIPIDNFGQVNEYYYRGSQPDLAGFQSLKKLGIAAVIDLREDGIASEPSWVNKAGMHYFKIPLSSTRPATSEQTQYFLKLVNDPANWPVYVHCAGGRHRAGEMTAIYRMTHDSWPPDQAYEEMKEYRYSSFPFHGSLKDYVYRYYRDLQILAKTKSKPGMPNPELEKSQVIRIDQKEFQRPQPSKWVE